MATAFAFVFTISYATFWAIKKTIGLRVTAEEEEAGLDIAEHGMYGYPEQFIPAPEIGGILEIDEKTVKSRLFEARQRLRELLSGLELK